MERPEKIYLDEPVELYGIRVGHTYQGLKYLVHHYTHVMQHATKAQLNDADRQHCQKMITNMQLHLQLYEKQMAEAQTQNIKSQI